MKQKTENRKPITSQLFGVPVSITSKPQALAMVGEWLRKYRSVIGSRLSVISSKSTGFQSIGPEPANRQPANQKQKTENRKLITGFPKIITTPNPEIIVAVQDDPEFLKALQSADLAIPDGIGIVWALKLLRDPNNPNKHPNYPNSEHSDAFVDWDRFHPLSGLDLMESLIAVAAAKGWRVMLLGGKPGVAEKAAEKLRLSVLSYQLSDSSQSVVGLSVAKTDEPKTGQPETENRKQKTDNRLQIKSITGPQNISIISKLDNDRLITSINHVQPDLFFVAFGHGKQEKWLNANRHRLNVGVAMGVGGALDQIANPSLRPPSYINSIGLGWLYRLLREPWRWRRQLALVKFAGMVVKERLKS